MKHVRALSCVPSGAQQTDISLAAVFGLLSDILTAVAVAVTAKESSNLGDLTGLLGDPTGGTSSG